MNNGIHKLFYKIFTTVFLSLSVFSLMAQTGPAGVGNADGSGGIAENFLWLDAATIGVVDGADVVTWTDISGNGTVFSASSSGNLPDFETNEVNGLPVVEFDDANAERLVVNPFGNMATDAITTIIVFAANNNGEALLSYAIPGESNEYTIFDPGNMRTYLNDNFSTGGDLTDGLTTFNIFASTWNGASGDLNHYKNSSNVNSATLATGFSITNNGSLAIGGEQDNVDGGYAANQDFSGKIAEIITFKKALNDAERIIIENYLSEKYSITIGNDFYTAGDPAYSNDIRGIGTADGFLTYANSGFSDALQIIEGKNSLNNVNEFVIFGHDNSAHDQTITTDLGETEITDRWARSWFVESSGAVSAKLFFDFGNAGFSIGNADDYVLLYRPDLTSNFRRSTVDGYSIQNTDQLRVDADNKVLATGYYTIGRGDQLTPGNIYSFQSGDWNDPLTWTTDPSGALQTPVGGLLPTPNDNIIILLGDIVTMDSDDNDGQNLRVNERLIIANTSGHDFTNIAGNGTISISGDASGDDNFPNGSTGLFADSILGGTVEIVGGSINLNQDRAYNDVRLNLANASNVATLTGNYDIFGDLLIVRGELAINDNANTDALTINAFGDVQIDAAGSMSTSTANARHQFNFYGDLSINGPLAFTNRAAPNYGSEATNGIVDANFLSADANQSIECNAESNFYRIEIDKGTDQTYILDINANTAANFNLLGPANYNHSNTAQLTTNDNALGLLRGTVRLNDNVDVPVLNNGGNYNISEAARLWVNGGSAEKPSGTAIVPYGTIQLSGGVINAPVNSGITTRANGSITVSDGVMTVNQIRTSVLGAANIGGYAQSGGEVNVTGNSIQTDYYVFSLTYPGNTFNMSGGTLRVAGARTGSNTGGIFIASDVSNQSVTGGTVIMEINRNNNYKLASLAPFWNVVMRKTSGTGTEVDLITGASGDGGNETNIVNPTFNVLNDLTIETGITFDHNGNNVTIGSDFTIEAGADYVYDPAKPNTTLFNGNDNCNVSFFNRTGDINDEQRFWNFVVDRPTGITLALLSGKTGANLNGNENNLLRIEGDKLELRSGILDQRNHSIRIFADTIINYDRLTVFNPANANSDALINSNNDLIKIRPEDFVLITADTAVIGNLRLNNEDRILTVNSDLFVQRLDYRHGRMDIGTNNLKLDRLDVTLNAGQVRTDEDGDGNFSVQDMIITAGNASDGGLSLYVPASGINPGSVVVDNAANTTSNPTVYYWPIGTGTTNDDAGSEFTPANIRLASATDDGYITVKVVTQKLATAGPYPLGDDISDRYWIVDFEDFSTVPKVERHLFRSVDKDDPNGAPTGFPANYVPGYVLEETPFTRTAEINTGNGGTGSAVINNNAEDLKIYFWGDTGSGNPVGGFDLVNAAYTAGDPSKFVGQPEQFFVRVRNGFVDRVDQADNWDNGNNWSLVSHTGPAAGDFPQEGDIAFVRAFATGGERKVILGIENYSGDAGLDVDIARLIFERENVNEAARAGNRIMIEETANVNFGFVEGNATFQVFISNSSTPVFNDTDFGNFVSRFEEGSRFLFYGASDGELNLPPEITEYPNVRFEGDNNTAIDRFFQFSADATINGDLLVDDRATFRLNRNITVTDDFQLGAFNQGFLQFDGSNGAVTLDVADDFRFRDNNDNRILINNSASNLEHRIIVRGDIEANANTVSQFDLFTDLTTGDNVILELATDEGESEIFENLDGIVPQLYKIVMNGGNSKATSFSFNTDFTLPDANASFQNVEVLNGELVLNDSDIDILIADGINFVIPRTGSLRISQANVNIQGDDTGILLDGCLIIDGGTLDMNDPVGNGNNFIEYSASGNAVLEISAGTLTVGSQIRPITTAETGILRYRQTGGDVRIGTQAGPVSNRGMLQIYNVGSEFTYTGGTLTIERHQTSPTVAALFLDPDVRDVSNSTITLFNANTPAGQTNFDIKSFIPLNNLVINGTNSPQANLRISPLTILGDLTIANNATFNGNNLNLSIAGDLVNFGTYNGSANETVFNSSGAQQITGNGINNFFRFTKTQSGTLGLTNDITVNGLFKIENGELNDNGNNILLLADAVIDGIHNSSGGNGLIFDGASNQELRRTFAGTGSIGKISIQNASGVTIPAGNGYNFNINGGIRLNGGVFDVGGANILLSQSALIDETQPFSVTNMIRTNSSFADQGVGKTFTAGFTNDFTFPLGQAFYTPVVIDFSSGGNTSGSTEGTLFVNPANEVHPTVNDGVDALGTGDVNNVLQYYWTLNAVNLNGFTADVTFNYNDALVRTDEAGFTEADYIAARVLFFNNPTNLINKLATTDVDEVANEINFNFAGAGSNGISGDYFAGIDQAIPDNVVTYIVRNGIVGDIKFSSTFTTPLPTDGVPPSGAIIEIPAGSTLQLPDDNIRLFRTVLNDGATLDIINSTNQRLGILEGTGNLRITSDGINATLPAFSGNFLSCGGGRLEYAGSGSYGILGGITELRNLTLSGSGDRNFPNNNVTICEDLVVDGPIVNNPNNTNITVEGNGFLQNGDFNAGTGTLRFEGDLTLNGGNFSGGNGGNSEIFGNWILISGVFNSGTGGRIVFRGDLIKTGGSFNSGSGSVANQLRGTSTQQISGDFTGADAINRLIFRNGQGFDKINGDLEASGSRLDFQAGVINMNGFDFVVSANSIFPNGGRSDSYVNGRVVKSLPSGDNFTFPIGSSTRWRPAELLDVNGGFTWEAQFFANNVVTNTIVDDMSTSDPAIATLQQGEYFVISDGASGGTASSVEISWGTETDVASGASDRGQLRVMVYNTSTNDWDNIGGSNITGNQNSGSLRSTVPQSFSEKIFIIGSTDPANPLPVELVSFVAKAENDYVRLDWETASEKDNDFFEIQRSYDGENFDAIGIIEGNGTILSNVKYSFTDFIPLSGISFYRLKQVDFDGDFEYSPVVSVNIEKSSDLSIVPNPTSDEQIYLRLSGFHPEQAVNVKIFNLQGASMFQRVFSPNDLWNKALPVGSPLKPGIYIVEVVQGNTLKQVRLAIR